MGIRLIECKNAVSPSRLPGLDWALNPYRGCAHGCAYCYAQDVTRFEMSKPWGQEIEVKVNIVQKLKKELERRASGTFGIGTVTDPYQGLEKEYELTRGCLMALKRKGASISILTKSDLVTRDVDILGGWKGAEVGLSIGCVDDRLAKILEPGAPSPGRRFEALRKLRDVGIEAYVMAAPIIQGLDDSETALKALVQGVRKSGVSRIMWDKFNPKPLATPRLRGALEGSGFRWLARDSSGLDRTRSILKSECESADIELTEAF